MFGRCAWRLIPFLGLLYFVNYLDRVNAGFAALTMNADLGFSPAVFGLGGGVLFVGYLLFQIPANAILACLGARLWMSGILVVWGAVSASTAFVQSPASFYAFQFVLGIAEAGLFPGIMFYLTLWFPQQYRARFSAGIVCAMALSGMVGGRCRQRSLGWTKSRDCMAGSGCLSSKVCRLRFLGLQHLCCSPIRRTRRAGYPPRRTTRSRCACGPSLLMRKPTLLQR